MRPGSKIANRSFAPIFGTYEPAHFTATTIENGVELYALNEPPKLGHNYGSWITNEGNARYGLPTDNINIAFTPRLMQLGFRAAF